MPWKRHRLRDADVWAKVDAAGALVTDRDGRVEIVYKPERRRQGLPRGARNLRGSWRRRRSSFDAGRARARARRPRTRRRRCGAVATAPANAIHVWTDGACTGNPGPAGDRRRDHRWRQARTELSEYLGEGTNNIAELTAILRGLRRSQDASRPVVVYSDSAYSIGLLTQTGRRRRTSSSSRSCARCAGTFNDLRFVKVAGHAGDRAQRARRSAGARSGDQPAADPLRSRCTSAATSPSVANVQSRASSSRIALERARACRRSGRADRAGARPARRGCRPCSASAKSMPCSSRLKNVAPRHRRRAAARAASAARRSSVVPIAGTRSHGVTATGSSTSGAWPRRHGAVIAGRYGSAGAASARGFVSTAPLGRPSDARARPSPRPCGVVAGRGEDRRVVAVAARARARRASPARRRSRARGSPRAACR